MVHGQSGPAAKPILRGAVTNQPLPRYVTLKGNEGNARRGPGLTHRIDWVYTTKGTPLRVTAEYENWRRVEDYEGFGGWVHFTLLSVARSVIVTTDMAAFHKLPDANAPVAFQAERGVLARLLECQIDWCRVNADGQRGWVIKTAIWGVDAGEVVE
jgi:SH3-like domain-containing protein